MIYKGTEGMANFTDAHGNSYSVISYGSRINPRLLLSPPSSGGIYLSVDRAKALAAELEAFIAASSIAGGAS